ncbi:MAG: hypothetical protein ABGX26_01365 [Nautiliaceae bacterium]
MSVQKTIVSFFLISFIFMSPSNAGELDNIDISLDLGDVDKPYSYKGYFKLEFYYIDDKEKYTIIKGELNFEGDYKKDKWYFKGNWSGYYTHDKYDTSKYGIVNELYVKYGDVNKNITVGKELLKWGKGYAYSAVSFFTRAKNPLYPEDLKQGYELVHFKTIDTLNLTIKNYSLDFIYMPSNNSINSDLQKSQNWGAKLYMLYENTDIDFMFEKSNFYPDKYGADFSFNILTELEVHGEYAFDEDGKNSYLLGCKYASKYDFTLTGEWYKDWNENKFIYAKISQKDFYIDYLTAYVTGIRNYTQNVNSLLLGLSYDFKNNFVLTSEYLTSTKQNQAKLSLIYYF